MYKYVTIHPLAIHIHTLLKSFLYIYIIIDYILFTYGNKYNVTFTRSSLVGRKPNIQKKICRQLNVHDNSTGCLQNSLNTNASMSANYIWNFDYFMISYII